MRTTMHDRSRPRRCQSRQSGLLGGFWISRSLRKRSGRGVARKARRSPGIVSISRRSPSLGIESGVLFREVFQVLGEFINRVDRIRGASRDTGAAADAAVGIDEELCGRFEGRLVFFGMDAIGGAGVDTEYVLDAGIGNHVSHLRPRLKMAGCL